MCFNANFNVKTIIATLAFCFLPFCIRADQQHGATTTILKPTSYEWPAPGTTPARPAVQKDEPSKPETKEGGKTDLTVILLGGPAPSQVPPSQKADSELVGRWVTTNSVGDVSAGPISGNIGGSMTIDLSENNDAIVSLESHAPLGISNGGTIIGTWSTQQSSMGKLLVITVKSTHGMPVRIPAQVAFKIASVGTGTLILDEDNTRFTLSRQ